ncbi:MAG: type III pantothenate kinase [Kiritimatiellae bacterium]|nr:type III pantothenate kinase [Kiritimatiellia bacterium]
MQTRAAVVVDIGNTTTVVGLATGRRVTRVRRLMSRGQTRAQIATVVRAAAGGRAVAGTVLCSVVPALTGLWRDELTRFGGKDPLVVGPRLELGVRIDYPRPARIGPDRLANACAAVDRFGAPVIVADFGTALTFDVISTDRAYVGGVIAPGLPLMTDYLAERTALLPRVRLRRFRHGVGKSTAEAMCIGAKVGYRGIVREIFGHLRQTLGARDIPLCATGGYAAWALRDTDMPIALVPHLTLLGLGRIHELNSHCGDSAE